MRHTACHAAKRRSFDGAGAACAYDNHISSAFIRSDKIVRSPAGKADYRWAKAIATGT